MDFGLAGRASARGALDNKLLTGSISGMNESAEQERPVRDQSDREEPDRHGNSSLYRHDGDQLVPTEDAGNPWGELTGGGPVAGLLARAVENALDDPDLFVARLTVDLLRPVPRVGLDVSTRTLRAGKRLQVIEASLNSEDAELSRATAQVLRRSGSELDGVDAEGEVPDSPAPFPGPDELEAGSLLPPGLGLRWGVHDVVEVRWAADQFGESPSRAWMRLPRTLVPGEALTPLAHTAVLVDCISAASPLGPIFGPWINTDITLYLQRPLEGEWLGVEIDRDVQPTGIGVARARLYDQRGAIGSASEAVIVNQLG